MAGIKGYNGSCTVGGTAVGTGKGWNVTLAQQTADTTTFSDAGWETNTTILKGWSGSIKVVFDGGSDTGEAALITGMTAGTSVDLVFLTDATEDGTAEKFTGTANITSMPISNEVTGITEVSFDFKGTGALTPSALV